MQLLRDAIGTFCTDPAEVEARSVLALCTAIGHHLLAADHPGSTRAEAVADAAGLILNRPLGVAGHRGHGRSRGRGR